MILFICTGSLTENLMKPQTAATALLRCCSPYTSGHFLLSVWPPLEKLQQQDNFFTVTESSMLKEMLPSVPTKHLVNLSWLTFLQGIGQYAQFLGCIPSLS